MQGCFWGVEQKFAQHFRSAGVQTAVGYTGGTLPKPTYERVRSKRSVRVFVHRRPASLLARSCGQCCKQVVLQVCCGNTGHAEAVQLVYDERVKYDDLVRESPCAPALCTCKQYALPVCVLRQQVNFFYSIHNASLPRSKASQYRSAIFYEGDDQKAIAEVRALPCLTHPIFVQSSFV